MRVLSLYRFSWVLVFLVLCACSKNTQRGASAEEVDEVVRTNPISDQEWINPVLEHRLTPRETPFRSFPFDANQSDVERIDAEGFSDFIGRMNASFAQSDLYNADLIYAIIQNSDLLQTQPAVLKSEDQAASFDTLSMEKVRNRVAVQKTATDGIFSIFYKKFDCGWNYSYRQIEVNPRDSVLIKVEEIETWVARTPC
jgi:hypothetical protein